jgi:hypothetical protein
MRRLGMIGTVVAGGALLLSLAGEGDAWARGPKASGPGLFIVANRIVGFVPFTVSIYGKVRGIEPGQVELCRSEVAWMTDPARASAVGGRTTPEEPFRGDGGGADCTAGEVVKTSEGFDYARDLRFDRPGVYQVRLRMVDPSGHRVLSNSVQVNAL